MDFKTEFKPLTIQPQEIEEKSFEMITEELGAHPYTGVAISGRTACHSCIGRL